MHDEENTWSRKEVKNGIINNYIEMAFIPPVHVNQLISSGYTFLFSKGT